MRRALLVQYKPTLAVASGLIILGIMADAWHIATEIAGKNSMIYQGLFSGTTYFNLIKSVDSPDIAIALADTILAGYLAYVFFNFDKISQKANHPEYGFFEHAYHHLFRVPAKNISRLYKWRWS